MAEENCSGKTLWDTVLSKRILVHLRKWVFHPDVSKSGAFQYIITVLHNNRINILKDVTKAQSIVKCKSVYTLMLLSLIDWLVI